VEAVKLQSEISANVQVRRVEQAGQETKSVQKEIKVARLVPGDFVVLRAGDYVPTDCLFLDASYLQMAQSSRTGESEPL
jgi:P-type Mg2+ transporter